MSLLPPTNPTTNSDCYKPPANDSIIQGATTVQGISLQPIQPVQQVITNHRDTTMGQTQPHTQTRKLARSDKPIVMFPKATHQTHQTTETDPPALGVVNKAT